MMETHSTSTTIVLSLVFTYGTYLIGRALYNITRHPLARFPGPKLAGAFSFVDLWHTYCGNVAWHAKRLHEQYGDIVRISPNSLSFNSSQAFQDIYGIQKGKKGLEKDPPFYKIVPGNANNVVQAVDPGSHARYRRLLGPSFSDAALREQEVYVRKYCDMLILRLKEQITGPSKGKVDIVSWLNFTTFDIIGDLAFGESFQALEKGEYHAWMVGVFDGVKIYDMYKIADTYPPLGTLYLLLVACMPGFMKRDRENRTNLRAKVERRLQSQESPKDFISHIVRHKDEKGMEKLELYSNMSMIVLAGSETSATLLSGLVFYLLKNPEIYGKLTKEVRSAFNDTSDMNFHNEADLPYLNACIEEALRIYPPVPMSIPRRTPPEGATIAGRFIPGNTTVGVTQLGTYYSTRNFKDPMKFVPERWLGDKRYADDDREAFHPFSLGVRGCLGKNLAYAEIRSIIVSILWNFDLEICSESRNWNDQKVFMLWEKPPLIVILSNRSFPEQVSSK